MLKSKRLAVYQDTNDELTDSPDVVISISAATAVTDCDNSSHQFTFYITVSTADAVSMCCFC